MKKLKPTILFLFILMVSVSYAQETTRRIHEVKIMKLSAKNNKVETSKITIYADGMISAGKGDMHKISTMDAFNTAISQLLNSEEKVMKVPGDNEKRTNDIQAPYNLKNIYITVIFAEDYDRESDLRNKTCYRYRETNIDLKETNYSFYNYFNDETVSLIKGLLQ